MIKLKQFLWPSNLLSISRVLLLIPFIILFNQSKFLLATIIVFIAALTDVLDGFISRKLNQVSDLGKILDPVADKIGLGVGIVVVFNKVGVILWPLFILFARDIGIILASLLIVKKIKSVPASDIFGKGTSFSLALTTLTFLLFLISNTLFLKKIGVIIYIVSCAFILSSIVSYSLRTAKIFKKKS